MCGRYREYFEAGAPLNISLFPNPAVESLTITLRGDGRWEQVAIYNSLGGLIETILGGQLRTIEHRGTPERTLLRASSLITQYQVFIKQ